MNLSLKYSHSLLLLFAVLFYSCDSGKKVPDFVTETPTLRYISMTDSVLNYGSEQSNIFIKLRLFDKDQDFGSQQNDTALQIKGYRSDTLYSILRMGIGYIPRNVLDQTYMDVTVDFKLTGGLIIPRQDSLHLATKQDTVIYKVSIFDEAGNQSNEEELPPIYIKP